MVIIFVGLIVAGLLPIISSPTGTGQGGSGNLQTKEVALSDFSAVDASHGFNVVITQGSNYSIRITTDDNIQQYVDVQKNGDTLELGIKPMTWVSTTTLKAEITMPDLTVVELSGGAKANAANFSLTHNFQSNLSGGSSLTMSGQATDLIATGSGGANMHFQEFKVHNANLDLSGGSQATVNLDGTLSGDLSGGARLFYKGNPTLGDINTSGGATINKID